MKGRRNTRNKPLVSVIMPVFNALPYLGAAIESILEQSYRNFELIIVNDASTDASLKLIEKYQSRHPRKIKVINLKKNLNKGGDECANLGLKIASGKYIARMDADDISHRKRLEKQVKFLQKNKEFFLVGSNATVINAQGEKIGEKIEPFDNAAITRAYFTFNPLIHPSLMYHRQFETKQPFSYSIKYSANNDYFTFFKLQCHGAKYANLQENLIEHRVHDKSDTFINVKEKFANTLKIRIQMVLRYGYRVTPLQIVTTILQTTLVFLLPQDKAAKLYLVAKGIVKLPSPLKRFNFTLPRFGYNSSL